jgi:hypothetical protein
MATYRLQLWDNHSGDVEEEDSVGDLRKARRDAKKMKEWRLGRYDPSEKLKKTDIVVYIFKKVGKIQ